jgi:SAM-dependent methyltransferase
MSNLDKLKTRNLKPETQNWFASWFDTPYYHILYKDRNYREAQIFMDNLTHYLNLPEHAKVLDLACGKGRHSIYLNQLGFTVLGVDLSEKSIETANKNANKTLHFQIHDMREPLNEKFDAVFNLFTSFGYFDTDDDNLKTLIAIKEMLSEYGFAVIDFMNVPFVLDNLVAEETKTVDEIDFHLKRYLKDGYIVKEIDFEDNGEKYHFKKKFVHLTLDDFQK